MLIKSQSFLQRQLLIVKNLEAFNIYVQEQGMIQFAFLENTKITVQMHQTS